MDQKEVKFTMVRPAADPLNSVKKWRTYRAACATFDVNAMMAAKAKVDGLTVATRNEVDFQAQGFDVFNPLASVGSHDLNVSYSYLKVRVGINLLL
jgi:hypothetical protein